MTKYFTKEDCNSKLGKRLLAFRCDRPSEWLMDDLVQQAEDMHNDLITILDELTDWVSEGCECGYPFCKQCRYRQTGSKLVNKMREKYGEEL